MDTYTLTKNYYSKDNVFFDDIATSHYRGSEIQAVFFRGEALWRREFNTEKKDAAGTK